MDSYKILPDVKIEKGKLLSDKFLELNIFTFVKAAEFLHKMKYGYNTDYEDKLVIFKENIGTCTSKHAALAALAGELNIPVYKYLGIYKFNEAICTGANAILKEFKIDYVPMTHCFLKYNEYSIDLTEGNCNGKNSPINDFIHYEKVDPYITSKEEYMIYKKVLNDFVIGSQGMTEIDEKKLLLARQECLILLKNNLTKCNNTTFKKSLISH